MLVVDKQSRELGRRILGHLVAFGLDTGAVLVAVGLAVVAVTVGNPLAPMRPPSVASVVRGLLPIVIMTAAAYTLSYLRPRVWLVVALSLTAVLLLDTSLTADKSKPLAVAVAVTLFIALIPTLAAYRASAVRRGRRDPTLADIHVKLNVIEAELRRIGYWQVAAPPDHTGGSSGTFEQWLQFVFLPNARQAVSRGQLPKDSNVGLMALRQYDYHTHVPEAQPLVGLLHELDALVRSASTKKTP
jgi:uncharacterized protein YqcC (DUF446 family)